MWEPTYERTLGVYSSRPAAVAAAGKHRLNGVGSLDEAIEESFQDDHEDNRNRPPIEKKDLDGTMLLGVGNMGGEWYEVYIRKHVIED